MRSAASCFGETANCLAGSTSVEEQSKCLSSNTVIDFGEGVACGPRLSPKQLVCCLQLGDDVGAAIVDYLKCLAFSSNCRSR